MKWLATIAAAATFGLMFDASAAAEPARQGASAAPDALAQGQAQPPRRARTKIRVRPLYPHRPYHSFYPPAADVVYPGPNAQRECAVRYVQEFRPSGTVIVPRMRCWWVRG